MHRGEQSLQPLLALLALSFGLGLWIGRWNVWLFGVLVLASIATALFLWRAEGYM
jgi:hypothetical protein